MKVWAGRPLAGRHHHVRLLIRTGQFSADRSIQSHINVSVYESALTYSVRAQATSPHLVQGGNCFSANNFSTAKCFRNRKHEYLSRSVNRSSCLMGTSIFVFLCSGENSFYRFGSTIWRTKETRMHERGAQRMQSD